KLVLAAPESFFSVAVLAQAAVASRSHFVMKDLRAAPASFFSVACALQVGAGLGAGDCALTLATASTKMPVVARYFIATSKFQGDRSDPIRCQYEWQMSAGCPVKAFTCRGQAGVKRG